MMELNFVKLNALIIGRNLKIQRIQAGLTQENIAEHIGVSAQKISNWESGKTLINLTRLIELSLLYQVDLYTLLGPECQPSAVQVLVLELARAVDGLAPDEMKLCVSLCRAVAEYKKEKC